MEAKSPFLSRTLWTNAIVAALGFFPSVSSFVSGHPEVFVAVFAGVNFALRLITKSAIAVE